MAGSRVLIVAVVAALVAFAAGYYGFPGKTHTVTVTETITVCPSTTTGIPVTFTPAENLQIITAYATQVTTPVPGWNITLWVKNVGTTDVTIDNIFINGKPASSVADITSATYSYDGTPQNIDINNVNVPVGTGKSVTITITIKTGGGFSSGQMVEVKLHSATGKEYPKQVTLP